MNIVEADTADFGRFAHVSVSYFDAVSIVAFGVIFDKVFVNVSPRNQSFSDGIHQNNVSARLNLEV